jgi:hypothetical protein
MGETSANTGGKFVKKHKKDRARAKLEKGILFVIPAQAATHPDAEK